MIASCRGWLTLVLATLLVFPPSLTAQASGVPAPQPGSLPETQLPAGSLRIVVLEGAEAINSIPLMRSVAPVVEVRDDRDMVVEGATVEFRLPASGPGGTFPGNRTFFSVRTNAQGQAAAPFIMNTLPGKFDIAVTATAGNREGRAVIRQTNSGGTYAGPPLPKTPVFKRKTTWILIGAAAAGVVTWLVLRDSGDSTGPVVIRPGGPVVGGPR